MFFANVVFLSKGRINLRFQTDVRFMFFLWQVGMTEEKPQYEKAQPPAEPQVDLLTPEEIEDLRADKKRVGEYARKAFGYLRSKIAENHSQSNSKR